MNPNNEIERTRVFRAVEWSYKCLEPFRRLVHGLVQEYAGSGYGKDAGRPRFEILCNLMAQTVDAYTMALVANRPRVSVATRRGELRQFAQRFEIALNNLMAEIHLECTLRQSVLDAFFCVFDIMDNDERVAAALYRKTVDLLDRMGEMIKEGNLQQIRTLIREIKRMDELLPAATAKKIGKTLEEAKEAAKAAAKKAKDLPEDKMEAAVKKMLKNSISVDGIRAELVEVSDKMTKKSRKASLSPVDARSIE